MCPRPKGSGPFNDPDNARRRVRASGTTIKHKTKIHVRFFEVRPDEKDSWRFAK